MGRTPETKETGGGGWASHVPAQRHVDLASQLVLSVRGRADQSENETVAPEAIRTVLPADLVVPCPSVHGPASEARREVAG